MRNVRIVLVLSAACGTLDGRTAAGSEPRNVRLLCRSVLDFEIVEQSDQIRLTVTSHPTGQAALRFIFT